MASMSWSILRNGLQCMLLLSACWAHAAENAATPVTEALRRGDYAEAFRIASEGAKSGDVIARGWVAYLTYNGAGTERNQQGACETAKEVAPQGSFQGEVLLARCLISGQGMTRSLEEGGKWARQSMQHGVPEGAYLLGLAYVVDAATSVLGADGKLDELRYKALMNRTIEQRADQIEAMNALIAAAGSGNNEGRDLLSSVLFEHAGRGNVAQVVGLSKLYTTHNQVIGRLQAIAAQVQQTGDTVASAKLVIDVSNTARAAAAIAADMKDCKDIRLMKRVQDGEISDAEYLPVNAPLQQSFLIRGRWTEQWRIDVCGSPQTIPIAFFADGMGGARYSATQRKAP